MSVLNVQAQSGAATLILTKSIDGDVASAKVGDTIFYRIRFACSSLTTDCGEVEITDILPKNTTPPNNPLFTYLPADSDVPIGFTMTEAPTGTITITKDDDLMLDGSQYDAVIAVRVNYESRPLADTVTNMATGQIRPPGASVWENPVNALAPPLTIEPVIADWELTKTRISPSIEPTLDTDVTYQLELCPVTTNGNVQLTNVEIIDTLPLGITFVGASSPYTYTPESGGTPGRVVWSVPGTITPPSCASRYVTVQYPSTVYNLNDPITNNASATADYVDTNGNPCPSCIDTGNIPINHNIIDIVQGVAYSKDDAGDPVGIDGTARFILSLDSNFTNYPANSVILIDTLPAELQVTGVTSGTWPEHVRARIQYATNYDLVAPNWVDFSGTQPVEYNDDNLYDSGLPDNITRIRWVFEYDSDPNDLNGDFDLVPLPGLPYDWTFSAKPEIRVTPRAADTQSDDTTPVDMLAVDPAALPLTFTNCLQASRIDSGGNLITGICDDEDMTVIGNYVSLRTTKAETPGGGYNPVENPDITDPPFTADSSILPNDTLHYVLTVDITERSSADLVNPVIQDTLPAELIFVRNGTAQLDGVDLAVQPHFSQVGQVLTWAWTDNSTSLFSIPPLAANPLTITPLTLGSHYLTVDFYARVPRGTPKGTYTNDLYVTTDSSDVLCEIPGSQQTDDGDIDGDTDNSESACKNNDTFEVERSAALRGEKWIRSTNLENIQVVDSTTFLPDATCPNGGIVGLASEASTNPFTRYPCISQAYPEGALSAGQYVPPPTDATLDDFEYNLRIFNEGNVPMLEYALYDILPYSGDKGSGGTLVNGSRNSEFRPVLRGPVTFISGLGLAGDGSDFTIEYSQSTNPCRPEVFDKDPVASPNTPAGCTDDWMVAASVADWTTIRAYRIQLTSGSIPPAVDAGDEPRFGVPMSIPADAPPTGFDKDDAQSKEIAWNSFSHVGSYDKDETAAVVIQDLLASEPRKVGITVPERLSIGNRVWRDSDNSGTINAPDDTNPGISGVTVNLYLATDTSTAIATTTTDSGGYYLFSNLPEGSYVVGIPASNFAASTDPLYNLHSSTGTPADTKYTTSPQDSNVDMEDHGIDSLAVPPAPSTEVYSPTIVLSSTNEQSGESDLSDNDRDGFAGARRGVNGERDYNSDLTVDFGFFGGSDIPFSIGNHVWYDDGNGGGTINDGIRQSTELPVAGVSVRLYRDGNANGVPEAAEMIRTDLTDANGFYLFDNLDPGSYYVEIEAGNFATGQPLAGWYSSQPTGTETTGVNGGTATADIDNDDNGINTNFPETDGVFSGEIVLTRGVPEPIGEAYLSGEADPGSPANQGYNPTGWDGPNSRGRFGEADNTSNLTIDFGFIPPMSLGNRVWIDDGAGTTPFHAGYNNGILDGTEVGVNNVRVELWRDTDGTSGLNTATDTFIRFTTTDANGYYLFDRLQPGDNYYVRIPNTNFNNNNDPLRYYLSSTGNMDSATNNTDSRDNGVDNTNPATNGINSTIFTMAYGTEPLTPGNETDINNSGTYGPNNVGNFGQGDSDSNLTLDFGFIRPRSIGNRLWIDTNDNGQLDAGEGPVPAGVRVSLYLDSNNDDIPDDLGVIGDYTDDWLTYDLTDANGYYLFDGLPTGRYIVGVDRVNLASGGLLEGYSSSSGSVDNFTNDTNQLDNGVDRLYPTDPVASFYGVFSTNINLTGANGVAPTTDDAAGTISGDTSTASGFDPTAGDGPNSRGRFGELDNNSDLTIDFGFFIPMSLGNRVFLDDGAGGGIYNNGIMDGGELPLANVRVELYRDANTDGVPDAGLVAFDTTDSGGYYLFDALTEGSYVVVIPSTNFTGAGPLAGYSSSTPTGTENTGVSGNLYTPDTDRDDNGINAGVPAVTGVKSGTITLVHGNEPTAEIELSGEADPGSATNMNFSPTGWDGPNSRGRWEESDANSNLTVDFSFIPVYSLGNRVWFDTNNDSAITAGEVGVDGVTVRLYASDGTTEINVGPDGILDTADDAPGGMLTASGGYYLFNNLPAGDYVVSVDSGNFGTGAPLSGYWSSATTINGTGVIGETTAALANSDSDSDDNGTLSSGRVISSVVTLGTTLTSEPAGETDLNGGQGQPDQQANMTVDFGFYRVEIGNLVYLDNNINGNYDGAPDTIIVGATVRLYASDGVTEINVGPDGILGTADDAAGGMLTNGSGIYTFSGLPQGQYVVKATSGTGTASTIDTFNATDNATPDTNADNNDNGIGLGSGVVSSGVTTLTPGSTGALTNNVVTQATGTTSNPTVDFGFTGLVAIGNRVWLDDGAGGGISNNGFLDGGEVGIDNVTVELYTSAGAYVGSTTTTGGGYYQFDLLYPGTYYTFIPAAEFQTGGDLETYYSSVGNGANETSDETTDENGIDNAAPSTNGIRSTDYVLAPGTEITGEDQSSYTGSLADANVNFTADFGFTQKYSLGNRVWFDTDNSSTINGAEVGIDGVAVNLYSASDLTTILATDTTANGGYYLFDDLYPGDYVVSVDASNFGGVLTDYWSSATTISSAGTITETTAAIANNDTDSDDNGTLQIAGPLNGSVISSAVTLGPSGDTELTGETDLESGIGQGNQADGRANMTVDFGFYTMSLGDLVWGDVDKNGAFNGAETGIDGVTVELWSGDGTAQLATTITAGGGLYNFPGLAQGDYTVHVTTPAGTISSVDTFASADTTDPTTNTNNNDNGVGTGSGTVSSNAVTLTPGLTQTSNTVDNATGSTANPSLDFGFTPVFALGNRVWFDTDNSSTINGAEVGIDGVTVNLYAAGDLTTILATQTTAGGGYYLFNNLLDGDYVVSIASSNFTGVLTGYWSSGTSRATDGTVSETIAAFANSDVDSDDNGTLQTSGTLNGAVISSTVTLGPAITAEPASETDLDGGNQGQPDTQANMTVDFGFYTVSLGDLVWNDADNSGVVNGAEVGIGGVTVELWSGDGTTQLATTTTAGGSGLYSFDGLPAGDYIVRIPSSQFEGAGVLRDYRSSTGGGTEPAPDTDAVFTDSDDNGEETGAILGLGGYIQTKVVTLTPIGEQSINNASGLTTENRVDFGVFNGPQVNLTVTKDDGVAYYTAGGTLTYTVTVTNNGPADVTGLAVSDARPAQILSWDWTCASSSPNASPAVYGCTPDATNPATFTDSLDLPYGASVTYTVVAQVIPTLPATPIALSNTVTVTAAGYTETDSTDNTSTDTDEPASLTVVKDDGLGVVAPGSVITYTIDIVNNGQVDLTDLTVTDTLPVDVIYQSATPAPDDPNVNPLTWSLGALLSGDLTQINLTVKVKDVPVGTSITNTVTVDDSVTKTTATDDDTDSIAITNAKSFISSSEGDSTDPQVFIGETLTYQIQLVVPPGTMIGLQALDVLDAGLAFDECLSASVSAPATVTTTLAGGFADACPANSGDPNVTNSGHTITFDFGNVENTSATDDATITVQYNVIVLDIASNIDGANDINNAVIWSWNGGSLEGSASPVEIIEPDLSIEKTVDREVIAIGRTVTYTIDIAHTAASHADAYDVFVTDVVPAGMEYVDGSFTYTGLQPDVPYPTYNPATATLTVSWSHFPLLAASSFTFDAIFVGPSPVVNEASVVWTSLPLDPQSAGTPVQQSSYNGDSTERWYDPSDAAGIDDYRITSGVSVRKPALPDTGFAPGVQTVLPAQPLDQAYNMLDNMWLEIPALQIKMPVVGIPVTSKGWDLTWLSNQAGYLEGTTYPSQVGTTGITGHVYLADGTPGPFINLGNMLYGNQVILHANGQRYIFEVRTKQVITPSDTSVFNNDGYTWLTLITCKEYDERNNSYRMRVAVRAVLVRVE